ncbi:MAG: hypothetical protein AAF327_15645 [Cyanobacteria bacterium P01_A01_bin.37]
MIVVSSDKTQAYQRVLNEVYEDFPALATEALSAIRREPFTLDDMAKLFDGQISISYDDAFVYVQDGTKIIQNTILAASYEPRSVAFYEYRNIFFLRYRGDILLNLLPTSPATFTSQLKWKQIQL